MTKVTIKKEALVIISMKTENRDLFWKIHIDYLIGKETHLLLPSIYNFLMALIFYLALVVFMHMSYLFDYTINS